MYVLLLSAVWCARVMAATAIEFSLEDAGTYFEYFIRDYNREYTDQDEKELRFQIFKNNLADINRLNSLNEDAVYGITKFTDLTYNEFVKMYTGFKIMDGVECKTINDDDIPHVNAPESWDWRHQNVVTDVKDQGHCGSCYAFSSTGNLESQYAIKHKNLVSLSEQQILDCDKKSEGCGGGMPSVVFGSVFDMGGIETEEDYPYTVKQNNCTFDKSKVMVTLTGCYTYSLTSQEKMKQLLYKNGPISIAVCAETLAKYRGGIISENACTGTLDHAVLLVGYGTDTNNSPYWIVKNSWGTGWGEKGYWRMERGEGKQSCCMMSPGNNYAASADVI